MATKKKVATEVATQESTKFLSVLGKNVREIKGQRAVIISEDAEAASLKIINDLKDRMRKLKTRLLTLEDINANGAFSTNPVKDNFDADNWIREINQVKLETIDLSIELEVAVETHNEWFAVETETRGE